MCRIESKALMIAETQGAAERADRATRKIISAYERFLGHAIGRRLGRKVTISFTNAERDTLRNELDRCARMNTD